MSIRPVCWNGLMLHFGNEMMPKVSVIIPTHNRKHLVVEAIESVRAQSLHDVEILVVDDSSTDGTELAVTAIRDKRIKYVPNMNKGVSSARNTGIRKASGVYVALLDDDDLYPPDYLKVMTERLDQEPQYGLAYARFKNSYPDGHQKEGLELDRCWSGWQTQNFFGRMPILLPSAVVLRRTAVKEVWFDEAIPYNEDVDFFLRLSLHCPFLCVPETFVFRRYYSDNVTLQLEKTGKSLTPWIMERFYRYYYKEAGIVSKFRARRKIASEFSGLAKQFLSRKCRKAAMSLYGKAFYYYPWRPRYFKKIIKVFFMNKTQDPLPDWEMPTPLSEKITVAAGKEG
jgi:glycosyltransferase involved in cell wall biosynthesis